MLFGKKNIFKTKDGEPEGDTWHRVAIQTMQEWI